MAAQCQPCGEMMRERHGGSYSSIISCWQYASWRRRNGEIRAKDSKSRERKAKKAKARNLAAARKQWRGGSMAFINRRSVVMKAYQCNQWNIELINQNERKSGCHHFSWHSAGWLMHTALGLWRLMQSCLTSHAALWPSTAGSACRKPVSMLNGVALWPSWPAPSG